MVEQLSKKQSTNDNQKSNVGSTKQQRRAKHKLTKKQKMRKSMKITKAEGIADKSDSKRKKHATKKSRVLAAKALW